jgi:hypothetical protein
LLKTCHFHLTAEQLIEEAAVLIGKVERNWDSDHWSFLTQIFTKLNNKTYLDHLRPIHQAALTGRAEMHHLIRAIDESLHPSGIRYNEQLLRKMKRAVRQYLEELAYKIKCDLERYLRLIQQTFPLYKADFLIVLQLEQKIKEMQESWGEEMWRAKSLLSDFTIIVFLFLQTLYEQLVNAAKIFEFPDRIRPPCTTMPWTIWPALVVLWGVCWMFVYPFGIFDCGGTDLGKST